MQVVGRRHTRAFLTCEGLTRVFVFAAEFDRVKKVIISAARGEEIRPIFSGILSNSLDRYGSFAVFRRRR